MIAPIKFHSLWVPAGVYPVPCTLYSVLRTSVVTGPPEPDICVSRILKRGPEFLGRGHVFVLYLAEGWVGQTGRTIDGIKSLVLDLDYEAIATEDQVCRV